MTTATKYTDEQLRFIIEARSRDALEWRQVAEKFAKKFGGQRTSEQMRHAFKLHAPTWKSATEAAEHPLAGFTHAGFSTAKHANRKSKGRWFVTAATPVSNQSLLRGRVNKKQGFNLFEPGFETVKQWLAFNSAEMVVLPMRAHMPPLHEQPSHYDTRLLAHRDSFAMEYAFNEHLRAMDLHINPQQLLPLTGMYRVRGGRTYVTIDGAQTPLRFNQSLIIAHAKQDMEVVGTGNNTTPRLLHTTGAITLPEYLPNRMGAVARDQHILGGLVVEVDGDKFWIRQVQFAPDGSFCDIDGYRYTPTGRKPVRAAAFRPGDIHGGHEDAAVIDADTRLCEVIKPRETYVEDVFDGSSISHHLQKKRITRARRMFTSLEDEIEYDRTLLGYYHQRVGGQLVVVASNHHEFLTRYLDEGRYLSDDNHELAHRMVVEVYDGSDPLQIRLDPKQKYKWLTPEDDCLVHGVQMAGHGDMGANGARGSLPQLERVYGAGMSGHSHTPAIRGRMFQVGHSSVKRHGYNRAITTWLNTRGIVWPGGQCQLVTVIDGRYCLADTGARE